MYYVSWSVQQKKTQIFIDYDEVYVQQQQMEIYAVQSQQCNITAVVDGQLSTAASISTSQQLQYVTGHQLLQL